MRRRRNSPRPGGGGRGGAKSMVATLWNAMERLIEITIEPKRRRRGKVLSRGCFQRIRDSCGAL